MIPPGRLIVSYFFKSFHDEKTAFRADAIFFMAPFAMIQAKRLALTERMKSKESKCPILLHPESLFCCSLFGSDPTNAGLQEWIKTSTTQ